MSTFTGESQGSTDNDNFAFANQFFAEAEGKAPPPSENPEILIQPQMLNSSKCASWVRDECFEIRPSSEPSERSEPVGSPLPESVCSWSGFLKNLNKNREKSKETEKNRTRKRESDPIPAPTFFEKFQEKLAETRQEIQRNPQDWAKIRGIFLEKSTKNLDGIEGSARSANGSPKSKFAEILGIFETQNLEIYESIGFDNGYKFNWTLFDQQMHQFLVFTKTCQSHPPEEFVEMRKEETRCLDCGSPNLAMTVRFTVPLDLSNIPIPIFEDVQIYVSFLAAHLLEKCGMTDSFELMERSCDFSKKNCEKMWTLYQRMVKEGTTCWEYKKWFDASREFVKTALHQKTLHLLHGRVIRRKIEDNGVDSKKRCHIFAQLFELDD